MPTKNPDRAQLIFGFLFTVLASVIAVGFLGSSLRGVYCHYGSEMDSSLSRVWCHYIDWDFRVDQALFSLIGFVLGIAFFTFVLCKQGLPKMYRKIGFLWASALAIVGLRFLLRQLGIDYVN